MARASDFDSEGYRFKSYRGCQMKNIVGFALLLLASCDSEAKTCLEWKTEHKYMFVNVPMGGICNKFGDMMYMCYMPIRTCAKWQEKGK